jgi:protease-4
LYCRNNNTNFFALGKNTDSLFASPFYINAEYAQSLIPSLYQTLVLGKITEKSEKDKEKDSISLKMESSRTNSATTSVVVIAIKQPIQKFSDYYNLGSKSFMNIMANYANDPSIAGIVLDIDSGGGQVYGTGEFYDFIREYPKPTVAYTDGYMCSAAYYLGNATQYIVANKRADHIGSIGAYATIVDFNGLLEKLGAKVHEMYATESTEKNSDFREVFKGNYEPYIKNTLDPIVATFHADMKATRPGLNEAVFSGGTWTGDKSLEMGLIDELGTIQTAIAKVFELADKSSNSNLNTNMNTRQLPTVQSVLGLDAPLASTEELGSYLNAEQLETVENRLVELDASNSALQTQLDAALANTEVQEQLTASKGTVTAVEASIDGMLTAAGLAVTGTLTEKTAALNAKVEEMGAKDGASHTNPKVDVNNEVTASNVVGGVDISAAMNN